MRLRDGDRWRDRIRRLEALPPPLVDGAPHEPVLRWRYRAPDRRRVRLVRPYLELVKWATLRRRG